MLEISKKERWKWIPYYQGRYKVSTLGRVKSYCGRSPRILKQGPIGPYLCVCLSKKGKQKVFLVHRLVLTTFVGPCPRGMECRHLNDIKTENHWPNNLVWGTPKQNANDAIQNGKYLGRKGLRGEESPKHKLTDKQVRKIIRIHSERESEYGLQAKLARTFKVSPALISYILSKRMRKYA